MARDFKSVGVRIGGADQQRERVLARQPVGIITPLQLSEGKSFLVMHYNVADQIADNLRNLLLTNHGERLCSYDFGANLRPLTHEIARPDWEDEVMTRIKTAVAKYMPFVELQSFESNTKDPGEYGQMGLARVAIRLTYTVPNVQETARALEVTLYVAG